MSAEKVETNCIQDSISSADIATVIINQSNAEMTNEVKEHHNFIQYQYIFVAETIPIPKLHFYFIVQKYCFLDIQYR